MEKDRTGESQSSPFGQAGLGVPGGADQLCLEGSGGRQRPATVASSRCALVIKWPTVAGLLLGRQRPGTTTGVVVPTVQDETVFANLVVWSSLFDRQRRIVLSARMLRCRGHVQREGDVIYVVAVQLETRRINAAMSATDSSRSRYHMVVATASRVRMDLILRAGCQCSRLAEGLGRMRKDQGLQVPTRSSRQTHVEPPCPAGATRNA